MKILRIFFSIGHDFMSFFSLRHTPGRVRTGLVILAVVLVAVLTRGSVETPNPAPQLPQVTTATIDSFSNVSELSLTGTVEALEAADIRTETGGRVTRANVSLGQQVAAGTIIATLENSAQYAALLQAQGAYESAQAGASAGTVSIAQAETNYSSAQDSARNALRSSYTTVSAGFFGTIDGLYRQPHSPLPGVMVAGGYSDTLNSERAAFENILTDWRTRADNATTPAELLAALSQSRQDTVRAITLVDMFIAALNNRDGESLNGTPVSTWISTFSGLRTSFTGVLTTIDGATSGLKNAGDALAQANISGGTMASSQASASIKQALGALKAAEANYNKTIIRTPIAGLIQSVTVKAGDYVGVQQPVAAVTNPSAYEVIVYVNDTDIQRISVGQSVSLGMAASGTVAAIAPGIDAATGKYEVKVQSTDKSLVVGSQVPVRFATNVTEPQSATLRVPIAAVRYTGTDSAVFTVAEDSTLVSVPVTTGAVSGDMVTVTSGVDASTEIVIDVRGLLNGQHVTVTTK